MVTIASLPSGIRASGAPRTYGSSPPSIRRQGGIPPCSIQQLRNTVKLLKLFNDCALSLDFPNCRITSSKVMGLLIKHGLVTRETAERKLSGLWDRMLVDLEDSYKRSTAREAILLLLESGLIDARAVNENSIPQKLQEGCSPLNMFRMGNALVALGLPPPSKPLGEYVLEALPGEEFSLNVEEAAAALLALAKGGQFNEEQVFDRLLEAFFASRYHSDISAQILRAYLEKSKISNLERLSQYFDDFMSERETLSYELMEKINALLKVDLIYGKIVEKVKLIDALIKKFSVGCWHERTAAILKMLFEKGLIDKDAARQKFPALLNNLLSCVCHHYGSPNAAALLRLLLENGLIDREAVQSKVLSEYGDALTRPFPDNWHDCQHELNRIGLLLEGTILDDETVSRIDGLNKINGHLLEKGGYLDPKIIVPLFKRGIISKEAAQKAAEARLKEEPDFIVAALWAEDIGILVEGGVIERERGRAETIRVFEGFLAESAESDLGLRPGFSDYVQKMVKYGFFVKDNASDYLDKLVFALKASDARRGTLFVNHPNCVFNIISTFFEAGLIDFCDESQIMRLYQEREFSGLPEAQKEQVEKAYHLLKDTRENQALIYSIGAQSNLVRFEKDSSLALGRELSDVPEYAGSIGLTMSYYGITSMYADPAIHDTLEDRELLKKFYRHRARLPIEVNFPFVFGRSNIRAVADLNRSAAHFLQAHRKIALLDDPSLPLSQIEETGKINGLPLEEIESRMLPQRSSWIGFLGKGERLLDILREDDVTVRDQLGTTHQALAAHIKNLYALHDASKDFIDREWWWKRIEYLGEMLFTHHPITYGGQGSPFYNQELDEENKLNNGWSTHFEVINPRNGLSLVIGGDPQAGVPVFIGMLGFYEGGTGQNIWRVDPEVFDAIIYGKPATMDLKAKQSTKTSLPHLEKK